MVVLDLFCGAGGVSKGFELLGFEVVGVDNVYQYDYPYEFIQYDVLKILEDVEFIREFDLVWASPPCQLYIKSGLVDKRNRVDLIGPVRELLQRTGVHYVIENVPGAPIREDLLLCGSHFGLPIRRHRLFECSFPLPENSLKCDHSKPIIGVYGNPHGERGAFPGMLPGTIESWSKAMGIDWMKSKSLSQAIPPAYSEYIGRLFLSYVDMREQALDSMFG